MSADPHRHRLFQLRITETVMSGISRTATGTTIYTQREAHARAFELRSDPGVLRVDLVPVSVVGDD